MPHYQKFIKQESPYHRRTRKTSSNWLWIGGVGGIGIVLLLAFFVLKTATGTTPAAAPQVTGAPRVSVVQDTFDYGDVRLGTTVQTVFRVRNVGDKPLLITNQPVVQVVEGCCPPKAIVSSYTIDPGQEGTITLDFMMHQGMGGKHRFNINLKTNDPNEPNKQLVVLSNWI